MEKRFFTRWRIALIGVFALSVLLYLPSLMGGSIWDDDDLISGAAFGKANLLTAWVHPFLGHYFRPLTSVSVLIDSSYANQTPFYYHQTNILLHSFTAVLVAVLAMLATQKKLAGVLAGFFFAAQPLQVGATAWIGGRTDVLSTFFLAGFLVSLVRYHQTTNRRWLIASAIVFLLAALSKEQAAFMLFAVPLSVFAFGTRKWKDAGRISIPFAVVLVIYIVLWCIDAPPPTRVHAGLLYSLGLSMRTAAHYGLALLTPNHPSLLTFTMENYQGPLWIAIGTCLTILYVLFVKATWKSHRPLAWLALCGLFVYMPISNLPPVPSFVAGPYRFAESGIAGACLLGIGCAYGLTSKKYVLAGVFLANLAVGATVTNWGIHQWMKPLDLFATIAKIDHHFMVGVGNYGHALDGENRSKEAIHWTGGLLAWLFGTDKWAQLVETKGAAAVTPEVMDRLRSNGGVPDVRALAWLMSCNASSYSVMKDKPSARYVMKQAVTIQPKDARINFLYGKLMLDVDRRLAIYHFEVAIKTSPGYSACAQALAHERVKDGRYAEAVKLLDKAMKDLNWSCLAWLDLADAKIGVHDFAGARIALDKAAHAMMSAKKADIDLRLKRIAALEHPAQTQPAAPKKSAITP
ncbi:MAG: glycosyltransferase family 39 protein [Fimbriimonas sp.]|nr:glycosyltransferase family 39 protein [Fimbriimonas sp.]